MYSFNVRGIRDNLKRRLIFKYLKDKYSGGIYLLQETHSSTDCEIKWKSEWDGSIFYNHAKTDSCGVAILISPLLDLNASVLCRDAHGRFLAIKVVCNDQQSYHICCIYAPTRNKVKDQQQFLKYINETVSNFDCVNLILGGDFNTIFDPKMDKQGGDMTHCINEYTRELSDFMDTHDMFDVIRFSFPDKKVFTRVQRSPPVLSRIDHWLISSHLANWLKKVNVYPGLKSDHSIIFLQVGNCKTERGRGFWKFNSLLLQDKDYVTEMNMLLESIKENTKHMTNKQLRWDYIKMEIRGLTLKYSFRKNKERRELKTNLEKDLHEAEIKLESSFSSDILDYYYVVKQELENILEIETRGAILRSKAKWAEAGEKNTKYFLNLEKRNAIDKHIQQLDIADGQITCDSETILKEQRLCYQQLYTLPPNDDSYTIPANEILDIVRLSEYEQELCEGILSIEECGLAVQELKNGKSPDTDGLTNEFYKFFWKDIKHLILDSLNYALISGELSTDQKRGIITLIPKKGKN